MKNVFYLQQRLVCVLWARLEEHPSTGSCKIFTQHTYSVMRHQDLEPVAALLADRLSRPWTWLTLRHTENQPSTLTFIHLSTYTRMRKTSDFHLVQQYATDFTQGHINTQYIHLWMALIFWLPWHLSVGGVNGYEVQLKEVTRKALKVRVSPVLAMLIKYVAQTHTYKIDNV